MLYKKKEDEEEEEVVVVGYRLYHRSSCLSLSSSCLRPSVQLYTIVRLRTIVVFFVLGRPSRRSCTTTTHVPVVVGVVVGKDHFVVDVVWVCVQIDCRREKEARVIKKTVWCDR